MGSRVKRRYERPALYEIPQPDGHFALRPCKTCGSDMVRYIRNGAAFHGYCKACGAIGPGSPVRHDAQVAWNLGIKKAVPPPTKVRAPRKH